MKAGTTTLFRRLGQHPEISLPEIKEPHFFSREERWAKGVGWYSSIFDGCDGTTGEASASYSSAISAPVVARRMAEIVPGVRIIYALRHPVERMRSHYRHQVIRARESRPFPEAAASLEDNEYLSGSLYGEVLESFLDHFDAGQLLIYRLEDLDSADSDIWARILRHIGVSFVDMPEDRHNISSETTQFTPAMRWLWDRGLIPEIRMPRTLRRIGKRILTRDPGARSDLLATAREPLDATIEARLLRDQAQLSRLMGSKEAGWLGL